MKYKVVETFISINGEGKCAGQLAVFIRFAGCNLRCSYCDTMWANDQDVKYRWMTGKDIYHYIQEAGVKNVTLTGGEPLIQEGMVQLLELLATDPFLRIEVETNGSVDIGAFCSIGPNTPVFTMDYKLGISNMEHEMLEKNFSYLKEQDTVKFVAGSRADLETAKRIIEQYQLTGKCGVHLSPVFGKIEMSEIVDFMKNNKMNDVRLQPQLHKLIWHPDTRGV